MKLDIPLIRQLIFVPSLLPKALGLECQLSKDELARKAEIQAGWDEGTERLRRTGSYYHFPLQPLIITPEKSREYYKEEW